MGTHLSEVPNLRAWARASIEIDYDSIISIIRDFAPQHLVWENTGNIPGMPPRIDLTRLAESDRVIVTDWFVQNLVQTGMRLDNEIPQHRVDLDAYWMGKYEVTRGQFQQFIDSSGYTTDAESKGGSYVFEPGYIDISSQRYSPKNGVTWQNPGFHQTESHPVVCVSWYDARTFADWAGLELPTEAEWEKAARSTDARLFPWGHINCDGTRCNLADASSNHPFANKRIRDGYQYTAPVGQFSAGISPYGCYDMAGNAGEWCADRLQENFYQTSDSSQKNPICESPFADQRVVRGGSWFGGLSGLRCASRGPFQLGDRGRTYTVGFRLASCKAPNVFGNWGQYLSVLNWASE